MKKTPAEKTDQHIPELKREQLGKGVRGKYFQQLVKGIREMKRHIATHKTEPSPLQGEGRVGLGSASSPPSKKPPPAI